MQMYNLPKGIHFDSGKQNERNSRPVFFRKNHQDQSYYDLLNKFEENIVLKEPLSPDFAESVIEEFIDMKESSTHSKVIRNKGIWSFEEQQRFLEFYHLHENKEVQSSTNCIALSSKKIKKRRRKSYFDEMSKWIQTRDAKQCRSHEQKYNEYLDRSKYSPQKAFKLTGLPNKSKCKFTDLSSDLMAFESLEREQSCFILPNKMALDSNQPYSATSNNSNKLWDPNQSLLYFQPKIFQLSSEHAVAEDSVQEIEILETPMSMLEDLILKCEVYNAQALQFIQSSRSENR